MRFKQASGSLSVSPYNLRSVRSQHKLPRNGPGSVDGMVSAKEGLPVLRIWWLSVPTLLSYRSGMDIDLDTPDS